MNYGGNLVLKSGEISAENTAIHNYGRNLVIGEDGAGPVIKAPIGIVNSNLVAEEINFNAVLSIYGQSGNIGVTVGGNKDAMNTPISGSTKREQSKVLHLQHTLFQTMCLWVITPIFAV